MNRNRRLVVSIISNILSVVVSLGVSFFLTPYLLRTLGKETYSFYPLANNFVSYMTIVTLALNSMASRFITIEIVQKHEQKAHTYFSSVFFANVLLSLILLVPMALIVAFVDTVLKVPADVVGDVRLLFALVFTSMLVNLIFSVYGIATFARERMDLRAYREIGYNVLRAGMFVALFWLFKPSIVFLGVVAVATAVMNGLVQLGFTRYLMPDYRVRLREFEWKSVFELVRSGVWNSVNNLGSVLTMSLSVLLANEFLGPAASGDLSIVQTLPQFMTTVISAVYGVLLARIATEYARGDKDNTRRCVTDMQKVLGFFGTLPCVLIMAYGAEFFSLWVPQEDAAYLQSLSVITCVPVLIHSMMWTVYGLNVTNNKIRVPALVLIGVGVLSVLITLVLLRYTSAGAYAVVGVSAALNGLFYLFFIPIYAARKMEYPARTFYPHILRSLLFAGLLALTCLPVKALFGARIGTWPGFFAAGILSAVLGAALYLLVVCTKRERAMVLQAGKRFLRKGA